jgi:hypothetical protein
MEETTKVVQTLEEGCYFVVPHTIYVSVVCHIQGMPFLRTWKCEWKKQHKCCRRQ